MGVQSADRRRWPRHAAGIKRSRPGPASPILLEELHSFDVGSSVFVNAHIPALPHVGDATLDNKKSQTRRLAWLDEASRKPSLWQRVKPGDRLHVRENWRPDDYAPDDVERTIFMADASDEVLAETRGIIRWRPSIHLPRARTRLTLIVGAVIVPNGCSTVSRRWRMARVLASRRRCTASSRYSCSHRVIRRSGPIVHCDLSEQFGEAVVQ